MMMQMKLSGDKRASQTRQKSKYRLSMLCLKMIRNGSSVDFGMVFAFLECLRRCH